MTNTIQKTMAHTFRFSSIGARSPLVNLSSGLVADSETETSLLHMNNYIVR